MRFKLALAFLLICGSGFADQNKKVQDEILAMVEEDQMARARISDFINISDQDRQTLHEIATKHTSTDQKNHFQCRMAWNWACGD
jgi:predicted RND superfamily exporter protein